MDIDLESIIDPCNIHLTWSNWRKVVLDIMDECIPTSIVADCGIVSDVCFEFVSFVRIAHPSPDLNLVRVI